MHAVPVLVVKSPVPGLLLINGTAACEVDGAASLPVSNTGDIYLLFTPYGDFLPAAMRLSFSSGSPVMKDFPYQVTAWPDGVAEIEIAPKSTGSALPGRLADELHALGAVASLIRHEGFTLLIEDDETDETLFRLNMPGASTGSLRELNIAGQAVIGALIEENGGQRLLLFGRNIGGTLKLFADVSGDLIRFEDDGLAIRAVKSLGDEAGHGEIRLFSRRDDGSYFASSHDFMLEHEEPDTRKTPAGYAAALTQAIALGLGEEAQSYISPEYLSRVSLNEIRMFLGAYSHVEEAKYCPQLQGGAALALITYTARNARVARVYSFECDKHGVSAIRRYDPHGIDPADILI